MAELYCITTAAVIIWMAVSLTQAQGGTSNAAAMTWYIGSDGRNETVTFTSDTFAQFGRCVCSGSTKSCTVNTANGAASYVDYGNSGSGSMQDYISAYICKRESTSALVVGCSRLNSSSCLSVSSYPFWSFQQITVWEHCAIGELKVIWDASQSFTMTNTITNVNISRGNLTCSLSSTSTAPATPPIPISTTTLPMQTSSNETGQTGGNNGPPQDGDDDDNTGVIVGVVVAVIICAILVAVGFMLWWRKKRTHKPMDYGSGQLSSYPVEIIQGGFNAFAEHKTRNNGNAEVPNSTEPQTGNGIANGNNASYYNLKSNSGNLRPAAYGNTVESVSGNPQAGDFQNNVHAGQDHVDHGDAAQPATDTTRPQRYFNTLSKESGRDGMEYEDVSDSAKAVQFHDNPNFTHKTDGSDNFYEIPVVPGKHLAAKNDLKFKSVHPKDPKSENFYSEIDDDAVTTTNKEDIVPPKRNRFLQIVSKAINPNSSVYELAKFTKDPSEVQNNNKDNTRTSGLYESYSSLDNNQSTPKTSHRSNLEVDNSNGVYDSGSQKYFELESWASQVKDTDD